MKYEYDEIHGFYRGTQGIVSCQIYSSHAWIRLDGVWGDAATAVRRKLRRMARQLGLCVGSAASVEADICVGIYSRKDLRRVCELIKFACGRKLAKTAANNNGAHNAPMLEVEE